MDRDVCVCVYVLLALTAEGPRSNHQGTMTKEPSPQAQPLVSKYSLLSRAPGEMVHCRSGVGKYKMSLQHFAVPKSKEVLKH